MNKFNFKKSLFLLICLIIIIIGLIYARRFYWTLAKEKNLVKVYGKVYYNDYSGGDILIFWRKEITFGNPRPDSSPAVIKKVPGRYCIYVSKDIGSFYVCAKCNLSERGIMENSVAYFTSDLITVDPKKNKIRVDVYLTKRENLMRHYKGPTVKISGRIMQEDYKKGLIVVTVETPENHKKIYWPPDIAHEILTRPGDYVICVPVNVGKVYINALNYPDSKHSAGDMPGVIFSSYNNPIEVGSSNIEGIDITLKSKTPQ